jgi:hypothetical protein
VVSSEEGHVPDHLVLQRHNPLQFAPIVPPFAKTPNLVDFCAFASAPNKLQQARKGQTQSARSTKRKPNVCIRWALGFWIAMSPTWSLTLRRCERTRATGADVLKVHNK